LKNHQLQSDFEAVWFNAHANALNRSKRFKIRKNTHQLLNCEMKNKFQNIFA